MARPRRDPHAKQRMMDRWRRQDEADRLVEHVPELRRLSIAVAERVGFEAITPVSHVRRVVVDSAPALFEIQCSSDECEGGYYDITYDVMRALERGLTRVEMVCGCNGNVRGAPCPREASFVVVARYEEAESSRTSTG